MDVDGRAFNISAAARRRVPKDAHVACAFGCQPGKAPHYIPAWGPVNIAAHLLFLYAGAADVLDATYAQLHADRSATVRIFGRNIQVQVEDFFGVLKAQPGGAKER